MKLKFFWIGFHLGRFSMGINRWPFRIFIIGTDFYGMKGIDVYITYLFKFWILYDFNKYQENK